MAIEPNKIIEHFAATLFKYGVFTAIRFHPETGEHKNQIINSLFNQTGVVSRGGEFGYGWANEMLRKN